MLRFISCVHSSPVASSSRAGGAPGTSPPTQLKNIQVRLIGPARHALIADAIDENTNTLVRVASAFGGVEDGQSRSHVPTRVRRRGASTTSAASSIRRTPTSVARHPARTTANAAPISRRHHKSTDAEVRGHDGTRDLRHIGQVSSIRSTRPTSSTFAAQGPPFRAGSASVQDTNGGQDLGRA